MWPKSVWKYDIIREDNRALPIAIVHRYAAFRKRTDYNKYIYKYFTGFRYPRSHTNSPRTCAANLSCIDSLFAKIERPRELTHQAAEPAAAVAAGSSPKKKVSHHTYADMPRRRLRSRRQKPRTEGKRGDKTGWPVVATSRESLFRHRRLVGRETSRQRCDPCRPGLIRGWKRSR